MTREELQAKVIHAKALLALAQRDLDAWETDPVNHRYESLEDAEGTLYEFLCDQASEDCEGSYNCGSSEYTQEFFVGDKAYIASAKVEYNRHDKQYYYVDGFDFKVEEVV
jgi:hypothetical protein